MENTFVADRLKEWGLEQLIEEFDRQKVDRETFLSISEEGIKEIIEFIGWRYTFLRKREEYLRNSSEPKYESTPVASTSYQFLEYDSTTNSNKYVDLESNKSKKTTEALFESDIEKPHTSNQSSGQVLRKLLESCLVGQHLLEKANCLSASDRSDLVRIIIEHQMFIQLTIVKDTFSFWANEIVAVFPKERSETYYIPYVKDESTAAGKLYDKYTNLKKKIKSINLSKKAPTQEVASTTLDRSDLDKLKNVSIENFTEIKDLWIKTHALRMVQLKEEDSISSYFEQYPILTNPIGSTLINLDFIKLYDSEDENIFMKVWPQFSYKLVQIALKKPACKNVLRNLDSDVPIDVKSLTVLPYCFRPTQVKSEAGKKWTPTYKEQADSFILFIDHMNDLQKKLEDRIKQLRKHRNSSQPFIVAVGNPKKIEACYVIIETVKYKYQNIFAAVDLCFKSFWALSLKYPAESKLSWIFIEKNIYGMYKNYKNLPAISALLSDLDSVEVECFISEDSSE